MATEVIGGDTTYTRKANVAGLAVQVLSDWRIRSSGEDGLLLSFASIVNEDMTRQVAQRSHKTLS